MLRDLQRDFASGLFAPKSAAVLDRVLGDGVDPARRLFVHYNTVSRSLGLVLSRAYPALYALLGKAAFDSAAGRYIRRRPPTDAALIFYGEGFGAFAAEADPALDSGLVRAIADIEWAQKQAFHAADAPLLAIETLRAVPPAAVPRMTCVPHPALRLCTSPLPAARVWRAAHSEGAGAARALAAVDQGPSHVAITRPDVAAQVTTLSAGRFAFLSALAEGNPVQSAAESAIEVDPAFDLGSDLTTIAGLAAFSAVELQKEEPAHGEDQD